MNPDRFLAADADRRQVAAGLVLLAALFVAGAVLTERFLWILRDPDALRAAVVGFGVFAPLAFVLLQAGQVLAAPVPGHVLSFAAGYLFGPVWGFVYSMAGATLGTYLALRLARRYGRPVVERFVAADALARFDAYLDEYGLVGVFVTFLLPGFPDDVICLLAGCTELDLRRLLVVTVLGRAPGYLVLVLSGAGVAQGRLAEAGALLTGAALVGGLLFWRRRRLLTWLERWTTDGAA